jgi:cyclohexadienyl dehydratase
MQRRAVLALATAIMLSVGPAVAQEVSKLDRILESGTLRVGTTGDFRPMSFRDPDTGRYAGFDIDVLERLARDLGVDLEFVATDWAMLIDGLLADRYDLTTSASMNVGRATQAVFSEPFVLFGTVPLVLADNLQHLTDWASIDGPEVTVAVTVGTAFEEQARDFFPNALIRVVEGPEREYEEVLQGRALVSLTSNVEAAALIELHPELAIMPVDGPRAVRPGAFLLPREDFVWLSFINNWVQMSRASGFFASLHRKWGLLQ